MQLFDHLCILNGIGRQLAVVSLVRSNWILYFVWQVLLAYLFFFKFDFKTARLQTETFHSRDQWTFFFFNQNKAKWINKWTELLAGDTNLATVPSCQKISINGWTRKHSIHRSRINKCCRHFRQVIFLLDNYTRAKTFSAVFVSSLMKTRHWSLIILCFYRLPSNELTRLRRPEFYKVL